ncbi:hypothetical protein DSL72_008033 [Monilinia vaccinii-corymbosi]|uniref:Uncharacterized protein n=1 Tax=Monilinia vaccinii-corymbosi TaxID=61207 RepID=A0A8A3PJS2_9HELO|nr:hypothetical protein DSL72_008033 [Monilinia vaccinii-corymbosi]
MSMNIFELKLAGQWAGLYIYPENHPAGWRTDGESDFNIETEEKDDKIIIRGSGRDKVGHFTLSGHVDKNTTVYFKKDYTSHWWHYTGSIDPETNMMYGKWGVGQEEQGGGGYFAFHLVNKNDEDVGLSAEYAVLLAWIPHQTPLPQKDVTTCANIEANRDQLENIQGAWSGFYIATESGHSRRCSFNLNGEIGKNVDLLTVGGHGRAETGEYRFTGVVSKSGQLTFAKVYGQYTYLYRGTLTENGMMMKGHWAGKGVSGTFYFEHN